MRARNEALYIRVLLHDFAGVTIRTTTAIVKIRRKKIRIVCHDSVKTKKNATLKVSRYFRYEYIFKYPLEYAGLLLITTVHIYGGNVHASNFCSKTVIRRTIKR